MKKSLVALAALASIAGVAQAQDGVSLYGVLDFGIGDINATSANGQQQGNVGITNSAMQSSLWGVKGSEDLGGGLKAIFDFEGDLTANGVNYSSAPGAGSGILFRRQENVGLSSTQWGTVQIGTVYDSLDADAQLSILPVAGNSVNFTTQLAGGTGNYFPTQAIKYTLPKNLMGGKLSGGFTYSSGNVPNQYTVTAPTNGATSGTYSANSIAGSMTDGYLRFEPITNLKLTLGAGVSQADPGGYQSPNLGGQPVSNAPYYAKQYGSHEYLGGIQYAYHRYSLGLMFTEANGAAVGPVPAIPGSPAANDIRTTSLGLGYQATDRIKLGANYVHNTGNTNLYNVQAHYSFSKQTEVYAQYAYVAEGSYGQTSPIWWGDNTGSTWVSNGAIGANSTAQAFLVGMIHRF